MVREVARQDSPPKGGIRYPVIRVDDAKIHNFVVASSKMNGFFTHFLPPDKEHKQGRTVNCWTPGEKCECEYKGRERRWRGYLFVTNEHTGVWGFLEVTKVVAEILEQQLGNQSYRGQRIALTRSSESKKARLRVQVNPYQPYMGTLPPELDPLITLAKLWKIEEELERLAKKADPAYSNPCGIESDSSPANRIFGGAPPTAAPQHPNGKH